MLLITLMVKKLLERSINKKDGKAMIIHLIA